MAGFAEFKKYLQSFSNVTLRVEEMKEKRREAEELMSHISLPETLRDRVRRYKHYKWKINKGVELDSFFIGLPRDLRRDIKRHLCLPSLTRVPMFEGMDGHLMDAMCERLKPVLYTQNSYILKKEIQTVQAVTDVEAFGLVVDDLMFVASQFRRLHNRRLQHTFRFYSQQWRTWAACYIQTTWRKHRKRMQELEYTLQDALVTFRETSSLSFGALIYVARFSSNALRMLRQINHRYNAQLSTPKPTQPDFENDTTIVTL